MVQIQNAARVQRYVPCLEGIRGYGFLLVFCGHYFLATQLARPGTLRLKILTALSSTALFAVPAFFVLSGYLIGGILYDTRHREGYFRVFYTRRILRVFPVYYVTLLAIAGFFVLKGIVPDSHFWIHFLYIQNLFPSATAQPASPVSMAHFWSLAVEEQFYLVWPLVVWFFPEKRKLMGIASAMIACSCALRLAAPFFITAPRQITAFTPTRVDAILLGVLLAFVRHDAIYRRFEFSAKWIVLCGAATMAMLAWWKGEAWSKTFAGVEVLIPLANITAAAIIVAVMEENSLLNRACSQRWVRWLGSLSYSLYVFHLTFAPFFFSSFAGRLGMYMRPSFAVLASGAIALALTLCLSLLCFLLIERPILSMKQLMRYGGQREQRTAQNAPQGVLVGSNT
jgi:peptidoglycan/LPS O-acetylase OafA/YrhL